VLAVTLHTSVIFI